MFLKNFTFLLALLGMMSLGLGAKIPFAADANGVDAQKEPTEFVTTITTLVTITKTNQPSVSFPSLFDSAFLNSSHHDYPSDELISPLTVTGSQFIPHFFASDSNAPPMPSDKPTATDHATAGSFLPSIFTGLPPWDPSSAPQDEHQTSHKHHNVSNNISTLSLTTPIYGTPSPIDPFLPVPTSSGKHTDARPSPSNEQDSTFPAMTKTGAPSTTTISTTTTMANPPILSVSEPYFWPNGSGWSAVMITTTLNISGLPMTSGYAAPTGSWYLTSASPAPASDDGSSNNDASQAHHYHYSTTCWVGEELGPCNGSKTGCTMQGKLTSCDDATGKMVVASPCISSGDSKLPHFGTCHCSDHNGTSAC